MWAFCDQLTEEEMLGLVSIEVAQYARSACTWTATTLQSHTEVNLEDGGEDQCSHD